MSWEPSESGKVAAGLPGVNSEGPWNIVGPSSNKSAPAKWTFSIISQGHFVRKVEYLYAP